jgi:isoleucyl-tRNA synthetase
LTLAPPNPDWRDAELEAHWERLLKVRAEALKLLETMRQAGTIGAPLEAAVEIGALGARDGVQGGSDDGALAETLARHRDTLKELFIVSEVAPLQARDAEDLRRKADGAEAFSFDGVYGRVSTDPPLVLVGRRAPGRKCQRCWMYFDDDSGSDLDPRCRAVVQTLNA